MPYSCRCLAFLIRQCLGLASLLFPVGYANASSCELEFSSALTQGAMVTGFTQATHLYVLERKVTVDPEGRFVFGLGRDIPELLKVQVSCRDGSTHIVEVSVTQRQYDEQHIKGVASKYVSPPAETSARIAADGAAVRKARTTDRSQAYEYLMSFIWPAKGPVSGVYGSRRVFNGVPKRPHYGLDIAGPVGTPIVAPVAGKVTLVHNDMYYSGGTLIIDHGRGISSTFIHLSKIHVKEGDYVTQGQLIADMGKSGRVTGPHLDWRINWFEQRLDPALLLPAHE